MVGVWMRADIEIEVILRYADLAHIGDDLVFFTLSNGRSRALRIAKVRPIGRKRIFP